MLFSTLTVVLISLLNSAHASLNIDYRAVPVTSSFIPTTFQTISTSTSSSDVCYPTPIDGLMHTAYCIKYCGKLLLDACCVAAAIKSKNLKALVTCGGMAIGDFCNCADCIPGLNTFVHDNGVCLNATSSVVSTVLPSVTPTSSVLSSRLRTSLVVSSTGTKSI